MFKFKLFQKLVMLTVPVLGIGVISACTTPGYDDNFYYRGTSHGYVYHDSDGRNYYLSNYPYYGYGCDGYYYNRGYYYLDGGKYYRNCYYKKVVYYKTHKLHKVEHHKVTTEK